MKPILFLDFDGTLCFDKYWRSLPKDEYEKVQDLMFGADKTFIKEWMVGKYTAEEVNAYVSEKTGIDSKRLWETFVLDCKSMHVSEEVLTIIQELRRKYTTILVTGNMDSFTRFTVPALSLEKYFDHINNSFFEGVQKYENGGEIFLKYVERLMAPMRESVLIDDSIFNCEVFKHLGGIAYQIVPEKDVSHYLLRLSS